eukprot:5739134-Prymnesium_polylepis.2
MLSAFIHPCSTFDPSRDMIELDLEQQGEHVLPRDLTRGGLRLTKVTKADPSMRKVGDVRIIYHLGDTRGNLARCNRSQWAAAQTCLCGALQCIIHGNISAFLEPSKAAQQRQEQHGAPTASFSDNNTSFPPALAAASVATVGGDAVMRTTGRSSSPAAQVAESSLSAVCEGGGAYRCLQAESTFDGDGDVDEEEVLAGFGGPGVESVWRSLGAALNDTVDEYSSKRRRM